MLAVVGVALIGLYVKSTKPQQLPNTFKQISKVLKQDTSPKPFLSAPEVYAQNLQIPWAIAWLPASPAGEPDSNMLVTERSGTVKQIDKNGNTKTIFTVPDVKVGGEGGLMGIAIHPKFASNNYVYLDYTYNPNPTQNKVVRYKYQNGTLVQDKVILEKIPGSIFHNGGRIKFGPDGYLYVTTGDAQEPSIAQDKNSLGGKILRITDEGKPAPGNPFGNAVYSYGHRNPQGLFWDTNGTLWETEHGPSGIGPSCCRDEVNIIKPGQNYGWPEITGNQTKSGMEAPTATSGATETWAPADIIVVNGKIYFSGLKGAAIFSFDPKSPNIVTPIYKGTYGRIRELTVSPDGNIYFTTSNRDGRGTPDSADDKIIKVSPNSLL